ncbi:MAG: hypothetical protein AAF514_13895 [Verrucomicrobiota bacterium]
MRSHSEPYYRRFGFRSDPFANDPPEDLAMLAAAINSESTMALESYLGEHFKDLPKLKWVDHGSVQP